MDAKVLRAAVSAAIRVTVSTTLLGCGGSSISGADGAAGTSGKAAAAGTTGQGSSEHGIGAPPVQSGAPPVQSETSGGGTSATGGMSSGPVAAAAGADAGTASGGSSAGVGAGGAGIAAGAGGEPASAGAPAEICGGAVDACLTLIEQELVDPALSDAGQACCETVIVGFDELWLANAECLHDLDSRFLRSGVRQRCCADQATWEHRACTPWGPPVPPELSAAALLAWGWA